MTLQGTNALVVLEAASPAATDKRPLIWRRDRFWAAPVARVALQAVAAVGHDSVRLEARLHSAALASLHDHRCPSPRDQQCMHLSRDGTVLAEKDLLSHAFTSEHERVHPEVPLLVACCHLHLRVWPDTNLLSRCKCCGRISGIAILPGAAVLDLVVSAAILSMRDGSASRQLLLSDASFVAPMPLADSVQQLARCSLDLAAGTARLSRPRFGSEPALRCASASMQCHSDAKQQCAATTDSCRASAAAHSVSPQHAAGTSLQQRLAQAAPDIIRDHTMLPVAPLDCTLQLSAVRSHNHRDSSRNHTVLVPSGLQACFAPSSAELHGATSSQAHWASEAPDGARDSSSHWLASASDKVFPATALEGVQFKPLRLESSAAGDPHPAGLSMHDVPELLYELSPLVVSPASSAAADAAPCLQTTLQLQSHRPASAASAALMALQTLGESDAAHGTAGRQAATLEGGGQAVDALLRTARLEQPGLSAALTGRMVD